MTAALVRWTPESSGPRWASASTIARTWWPAQAPSSSPPGAAIPQTPHMSGPGRRRDEGAPPAGAERRHRDPARARDVLEVRARVILGQQIHGHGLALEPPRPIVKMDEHGRPVRVPLQPVSDV